MLCHAPDGYAVPSLSPWKPGRASQWEICGWKNYNGIRERFFTSTAGFPSILVNQCSILFIFKATTNSRGKSEAWGPSNKVMLFCKPGSTQIWHTQTLQHSCEQLFSYNTQIFEDLMAANVTITLFWDWHRTLWWIGINVSEKVLIVVPLE
jgi:hypothetical protein